MERSKASMAPNLHRPKNSLVSPGFGALVTPENAGWSYSSLRVFWLAAGESRRFETGPDEMLVVPLSGGLRVDCEGSIFDLVGRRSVFSRVTMSNFRK